MVTLRLFAGLRESAGTGSIEFDAATVGEALEAAVAKFGSEFAAGLEAAQVWVNGDQAHRETRVAAGDEIAAIPPVSGGATTLDRPTDLMWPVLTGVVWVTLLLANLTSPEALALAAVGTTIAWLWDVRDTVNGAGFGIQVVPAMIAATVGGAGAYRWGETGLGVAIALAVMVTLAWAVADATNRHVPRLAVTVLLSGMAALATGSMVILGLRSQAEVTAFLVLAAAAAVAEWFGRRFGGVSIDPNLAILIVVTLVGLAVGALAGSLQLVVVALAAAITAGGFIAGRAVGSLLRNGDVLHTIRAPGVLTMMDPAVIGVSVWFVSLLVFSSIAPA